MPLAVETLHTLVFCLCPVQLCAESKQTPEPEYQVLMYYQCGITCQIPKVPITEYRVPILPNSHTGKKPSKAEPTEYQAACFVMEGVSCGI